MGAYIVHSHSIKGQSRTGNRIAVAGSLSTGHKFDGTVVGYLNSTNSSALNVLV